MHSFRSFLSIEWLVTNAVCLVDLLTLNLKDMEFRNYTPHVLILVLVEDGLGAIL